jgi:hypothetical protein
MPAISIIDAFSDLPDPRLDRTKRHQLSDILIITLCGAICGVDNWVEMERFGGAKIKWVPFSTCQMGFRRTTQ